MQSYWELIYLFPEPTTKSVWRIVLSLGASVLVKLHSVPPSEINNLRENLTEVQLYTDPRVTLHIKSFTTKNICLGYLRISAHKFRSSSSVISSYSHESLFPQFFSVQLQGRACSNTIVQVWRERSVWTACSPLLKGCLWCISGFHFQLNSFDCLFMLLSLGVFYLPLFPLQVKGACLLI